MNREQLVLIASILEHVVEVDGVHIDTLRAMFPTVDDVMFACTWAKLMTYSEERVVGAAPAGRKLLAQYWTATGRDAETGMALDIAR